MVLKDILEKGSLILTKKNTSLVFSTKDEDAWFWNVDKIVGNNINSTSLIIISDVEKWVNYFMNDGYEYK